MMASISIMPKIDKIMDTGIMVPRAGGNWYKNKKKNN